MKYIFIFISLLFIGINTVNAYELVLTEIDRPYEIVTVEKDFGPRHIYLGELNDYPVMYEITTEESFDLSVKIRQQYNNSGEPLSLSLIIIKQNERGGGVTEVARLRPSKDSWVAVKDSVFGMTFWESETLSRTVEPGIYRIEISTPDNIGRYMLTVGDDEDLPGYFKTLANVHTTQKFFGHSIFRLISSSYVYYMLGILFLLFVIRWTWKYHKSFRHVE
jgi:hypothetical protein